MNANQDCVTVAKASSQPGEPIPPRPMWRPPAGWHRAHCLARDSQALFEALVDDNEVRIQNDLPGFEPSYELAVAALKR